MRINRHNVLKALISKWGSALVRLLSNWSPNWLGVLKKENAKVVRGLPSELTHYNTTQAVVADYQSDLETDSLGYKINY